MTTLTGLIGANGSHLDAVKFEFQVFMVPLMNQSGLEGFYGGCCWRILRGSV